MKLHELETPALILDRLRLERNVGAMRAHLSRLGVGFRPHMKTPKSIDVAHCVMPTASGPITVSTLKEAEYFASHGVRDILYAVGIAPNKVAHAARLIDQGVTLGIILDSIAAASALPVGARFNVLIEIDCDGHRSGVAPDSPLLPAIADAVARNGQIVAGVMTHAGSSYNCESIEAIRRVAETERAAAVHAATRLRAAGHAAPTVSVGSTPTAKYAQSLDGVTEVRAGVFMFYDLVMAGIDVCRTDDIALSVLASVIGHQADRGWLITDAGWMAMSRDRGTARQRVDQGYGIVCDLDGHLLEDFMMVDANQEHGIVARRDGGPIDPARFPPGTLLRVLPNHACATAAQHGQYHVVEGSTAVTAVWPRMGGW